MKKYRRLIAMGLAASFLAMFGCTQKEAKFKPIEGAEIMSLSIFESSMDLTHCYSYLLHEEDDGTVLFTAEFQNPDDFGRVVLEDCEVDKAYMDELRKIAEEHGVVEYIKVYKNRKSKVDALDAPSYATSIAMSDGSQKSIDKLCDGSFELKELFIKIAEECDSTGQSEISSESDS